MRTQQLFKWSAVTFFLFHFLLRQFLTQPSIASDLILFNTVIFVATASLLQAPLYNGSLTIIFTSLACLAWGIDSIISSISEFSSITANSQIFSNIAYTSFYPFALLAIPRIIGKIVKLKLIEILDVAIFGLGLSSIASALLLNQLIPRFPGSKVDAFFSVLYPICDIALVVSVIIGVVITGLSKRNTLLLLGILIFALSDLYFLWQKITGSYKFGQASDDGWLLGLVLLTLALWFMPSDQKYEVRIHPALIAVSIFISPALLSAIALAPEYFPSYVVIPTIATLFLAFIRMTLVIRQASSLGDEKVLARTDELTGLPNRRRLIAEIEAFSGVEGALMLLDLDGFKPINDQYGHEMGDIVLRQVAIRFSRSLPTGAVLARLGGDEFGVLVSGNSDLTREIANALHATLSYPFSINGNSIAMSVSIGHVRNDLGGELLQRADLAMYEAKRSGLAIVEAAAFQP